MKRLLWLLALAAALAGCNSQQQSQADKTMQNAKESTQNALDKGAKELTDVDITAKVKTAMGMSDKLKNSSISVSTSHKVVTLTGTVVDAKQKKIADQLAKDTVGTDVKVVDQLKVQAASKNSSKSDQSKNQ